MNMGLGADWCNAGRAFMFALGCVQSMQCHTDRCPTGVATQDPARQRGLVIEDKWERVARFQRQTLATLREMVIAMGYDNPWQINPASISERLDPARSGPMDALHRFLEPGTLLQAPDDTQYARYWKAAQAHTFQAAA